MADAMNNPKQTSDLPARGDHASIDALVWPLRSTTTNAHALVEATGLSLGEVKASLRRAAQSTPEIPTYKRGETIIGPVRSFEIHVSAYIDDFVRRFGRKIKQAGGTYSHCRGHEHKRYVKVPNTTEGRQAADVLIASQRAGRRPTIIIRGVGEHALPAWVVVTHDAASISDALQQFATSLANACERGIVQVVEPDDDGAEEEEAAAAFQESQAAQATEEEFWNDSEQGEVA